MWPLQQGKQNTSRDVRLYHLNNGSFTLGAKARVWYVTLKDFTSKKSFVHSQWNLSFVRKHYGLFSPPEMSEALSGCVERERWTERVGWQLFTEKISRSSVAGRTGGKKGVESQSKDMRHAFLERDEYYLFRADSEAPTSRGTIPSKTRLNWAQQAIASLVNRVGYDYSVATVPCFFPFTLRTFLPQHQVTPA